MFPCQKLPQQFPVTIISGRAQKNRVSNLHLPSTMETEKKIGYHIPQKLRILHPTIPTPLHPRLRTEIALLNGTVKLAHHRTIACVKLVVQPYCIFQLQVWLTLMVLVQSFSSWQCMNKPQGVSQCAGYLPYKSSESSCRLSRWIATPFFAVATRPHFPRRGS